MIKNGAKKKNSKNSYKNIKVWNHWKCKLEKTVCFILFHDFSSIIDQGLKTGIDNEACKIYLQKNLYSVLVQLDSGQFQENTSEYLKWKEWRERAAQDLRQSVSCRYF